MALGFLAIMFITIIIIGFIIQILLYKSKESLSNNEVVFMINMLFGVFVSFITYTALPSNFTGQKVLAATWGILAVLGVIVKFKTKQADIISKLILTVSIFGGVAQLLLF